MVKLTLQRFFNKKNSPLNTVGFIVHCLHFGGIYAGHTDKVPES